MNISYDHYRVFYYVAKYKSFTRAAEILYNNQPNLTRAIKTLEKEIGCTLFERTNKGVRLTEDGQKLYEHISLAFEHIQAGEEAISLKRSLKSGIVSIGASEIALRCYLLPILDRYHSLYEGVRIKILNVSTPQALKMLDGKLIDLAVITTPLDSEDGFVEKKLKEFCEIPVCGKTLYDTISRENCTKISDLAEYPIISLGPKTATFDFYSELFTKHNCRFEPDVEAATTDQILPLVKHNLGIGFVPEELLAGDSDGLDVKRIELEEELPSRSICLVKKKNHSLPLPAKEMEKMILGK